MESYLKYSFKNYYPKIVCSFLVYFLLPCVNAGPKGSDISCVSKKGILDVPTLLVRAWSCGVWEISSGNTKRKKFLRTLQWKSRNLHHYIFEHRLFTATKCLEANGLQRKMSARGRGRGEEERRERSHVFYRYESRELFRNGLRYPPSTFSRKRSSGSAN